MSLASCASPEPRRELPLQEAPAFSVAGDAAVQEKWWRAFDDEALNTRINRALSENFSLAAAWERLQQAEAIVEFERANLLPQLDGSAVAELLDGSNVSERTQLSLGLEASYELDLWGNIQSAVDAERLRATATAAEYQAAAITVSAEVALTWYELSAAKLQLQLIESQLETNRTVLDVLEKRFAVGQSGSADVLRQRQLVEATREQLVVARTQIRVLQHQLAVLEGRPPQEIADLSETSLPAVPAMPATGLPLELLQRRPDVRSAFWQLMAADEDIAFAVTNQYPRINITGALSTAGENPSALFSDWLASLAGQLVAPLLDGGQRRAEVQRTQALRRERLAAYGETVLEAFQDVEDALAQEMDQVDRIDSLDRQHSLATSTYQQLRTQYLNGAADFIDVLTALREQQQIERDLITARLDRLAFRIALYRALAGGFDTPRESEMRREISESEDEEGDSVRG